MAGSDLLQVYRAASLGIQTIRSQRAQWENSLSEPHRGQHGMILNDCLAHIQWDQCVDCLLIAKIIVAEVAFGMFLYQT